MADYDLDRATFRPGRFLRVADLDLVVVPVTREDTTGEEYDDWAAFTPNRGVTGRDVKGFAVRFPQSVRFPRRRDVVAAMANRSMVTLPDRDCAHAVNHATPIGE